MRQGDDQVWPKIVDGLANGPSGLVESLNHVIKARLARQVASGGFNRGAGKEEIIVHRVLFVLW
jgi:hypothetical protein